MSKKQQSDIKKKGGPGRTKGVPNKLSGMAKENIIAVFTRIGGTAAMAAWAQENQTEFYRIYARLLPVQNEHSGPDGGPITVVTGVPDH